MASKFDGAKYIISCRQIPSRKMSTPKCFQNDLSSIKILVWLILKLGKMFISFELILFHPSKNTFECQKRLISTELNIHQIFLKRLAHGGRSSGGTLDYGLRDPEFDSHWGLGFFLLCSFPSLFCGGATQLIFSFTSKMKA